MTEDSLSDLRVEIDALDGEILRMLNERAKLAVRVGEVKHRSEAPMYVPERERDLLDRLKQRNDGPLSNESLKSIYKEIMSASLALEAPLRIAYLGPEATFTHQAVSAQFGSSGRALSQKSISDVFDTVERDEADYGVVPIENSTEGVVTYTLDRLMQSDLNITAEVLLEVHHCFLRLEQSESVPSRIFSHPQALAQCRGWLQKNYPDVPVEATLSTAEAARLASGESTYAAIAGEMAAKIYGLQILSPRIEDVRNNYTRFLVLGYHHAKETGRDRTSIMFGLKDSPGILSKALAPFAAAGVNLSRIESRPSRKRAWDYLFFIDLEGHRNEKPVGLAIQSLETCCEFMKVLGSYPQGILRKKGRHFSKAAPQNTGVKSDEEV